MTYTNTYAEKIEDYIAGNLTDKRTINSLKNRRYIDRNGDVTSAGYRETGVFRNMPKLNKIEKDFDVNDVVLVNENMISPFSEDQDETHEYYFDANKIKEFYNHCIDMVNEKIKSNWSWTYEFAEENLKDKTNEYFINRMKSGIFHGDFYYTHDMLISIAKAMMEDETTMSLRTSQKYSFTDTDFETKLLEVKRNGKTKTIMVVDIAAYY